MALHVAPPPGAESLDPPSAEQATRIVEHYLRLHLQEHERFVIDLLAVLFPSTSWAGMTRDEVRILLTHLDVKRAGQEGRLTPTT